MFDEIGLIIMCKTYLGLEWDTLEKILKDAV